MSYVKITEKAGFLFDLQKAAEVYAREKKANSYQVEIDLVPGGWLVESTYYVNFGREKIK